MNVSRLLRVGTLACIVSEILQNIVPLSFHATPGASVSVEVLRSTQVAEGEQHHGTQFMYSNNKRFILCDFGVFGRHTLAGCMCHTHNVLIPDCSITN